VRPIVDQIVEPRRGNAAPNVQENGKDINEYFGILRVLGRILLVQAVQLINDPINSIVHYLGEIRLHRLRFPGEITVSSERW
jgi:hypothetical protein